MHSELACKRFAETLFLHTVLANYHCLHVFLLLENSENPKTLLICVK